MVGAKERSLPQWAARGQCKRALQGQQKAQRRDGTVIYTTRLHSPILKERTTIVGNRFVTFLTKISTIPTSTKKNPQRKQNLSSTPTCRVDAVPRASLGSDARRHRSSELCPLSALSPASLDPSQPPVTSCNLC